MTVLEQIRHDAEQRLYADLCRDWPTGSRVQTHPATDAWISGDRYGTVVKVGRRTMTVYVKMDRSGRTLRFGEINLTHED